MLVLREGAQLYLSSRVMSYASPLSLSSTGLDNWFIIKACQVWQCACMFSSVTHLKYFCPKEILHDEHDQGRVTLDSYDTFRLQEQTDVGEMRDRPAVTITITSHNCNAWTPAENQKVMK